MGVRISYMGTKRNTAKAVSSIVQQLPSGPMLDVFSGMCAVAEDVAPSRPVWTNDIQVFPALVAKALFCSKSGPFPSDRIKCILEPSFRRNLKALESRFHFYLRKERKYLSTETYEDIVAGSSGLPYVGNDRSLERERGRLARKSDTFPYRLATITYAGSFFGVQQCMELDSIRYAIDSAQLQKHIDHEQKDWLIIALGQVASRINNSTGQFAQYIKPNKKNIQRILEKRRRSVWDEFLPTLDSISPFATCEWRSRNRSFNSEALALLTRMKKAKYRPAIVYADPPYSSAQYSRYYHVLDILVEYRYPPVTCVGRYPDGRFQTPFAHTNGVCRAVSKLVQNVSKLNSSFVLSYPENGLFCQKGGNVIDLLKRHFANIYVAYSNRHYHSTFGGPAASPKIPVVENVYVAYN